MESRKNTVKAKVLYFLKRSADSGFGWQTLPAVAASTGVSRASLVVLTKRWHGWKLIKMQSFGAEAMSDGHNHSLIAIASHGRTYLEGMSKWFPQLEALKAEVDKISKENCEGYNLRVRSIVWPVRIHTPDGKERVAGFVGIAWPFQTSDDAYRLLGVGDNFVVDSINTAFTMAQSLFGVIPAGGCMSAARTLRDIFVREGVASGQQRA